MSSEAITTIAKMIESLLKETQDQDVDHLREYIDELQDEMKWEQSFKRTQSELIAAAKNAKRDIAEGKRTAMDYNQL
mgnify:FL=1